MYLYRFLFEGDIKRYLICGAIIMYMCFWLRMRQFLLGDFLWEFLLGIKLDSANFGLGGGTNKMYRYISESVDRVV